MLCSICNVHKPVSEQAWSDRQMKTYRTDPSGAVCFGCRDSGRTRQSKGTFKCAACSLDKTRGAFTRKDLSNKQQKEKAGTEYTLVCEACKERETHVKGVLDQLSGKLCKRCRSGMHKHKEDCTMTFKARLTRDDLKFVGFRWTTRTYYDTLNITYYERLGVLSEEKSWVNDGKNVVCLTADAAHRKVYKVYKGCMTCSHVAKARNQKKEEESDNTRKQEIKKEQRGTKANEKNAKIRRRQRRKTIKEIQR